MDQGNRYLTLIKFVREEGICNMLDLMDAVEKQGYHVTGVSSIPDLINITKPHIGFLQAVMDANRQKQTMQE